MVLVCPLKQYATKKEALNARKRYQKNCQRTTKKEASELEISVDFDRIIKKQKKQFV
ncbi:MAG: hypothetical protein ACI8PB_003004 [Desulforhopalus sp.]|jgi:uncharacterized protein (DUF2225 family)